MTSTAAQIAQLRQMVNEPMPSSYSAPDLSALIKSYPLMDELGTEPYYWNYLTVPPTKIVNTAWVPTYDLNAAAADVWDEKAAVVAVDFQFSADGGSYSRNQVFEQYTKQAAHFRARRSASTIRLRPFPRPLPTAIDEDFP